MTDNAFFDETTEQSRVKAAIVSKYFFAWAKVIIPTAKRMGERIVYIDLFAGPGRYKDGTKSTPLLILEQAIADTDMRHMLVTYFNDADGDNSDSLSRAIDRLPNVTSLHFKPQIANEIVGEEIVREFNNTRLAPTLFFVDPWGYKGLSLDLIGSVLKDWGCDCIFFFNYNRINMGLRNPIVEEHMNALFGKARADSLRERLEGVAPRERELTIVEELAAALKDKGGRYVLPFAFRNERGERTSHHLIFVSKHFRGYEIMKDIMARESSSADQGVPSFMYNPADRRQPLLFELTRPLEELSEMLLREYAGRTLTLRQIYEQHSVGRPFILRNYRDVIRRLEGEDRLSVSPPAMKRPKRNGEVTVAEHVTVTFPQRRTLNLRVG
jgi:three-Cys-motif partner protein